jgi:geranylgeranyl reductase family protein
MEKYDVIIIGSGPAGSSAGILLAKAGKHCLLIDKEVFPRDKLCGGAITEKTIKLVESIFGSLANTDIIDSSFSTYRINHGFLENIVQYTHPTKKICFINRVSFDNFLLQKAKESGCKSILGDRVVDISQEGNDFLVILESGQQLTTKLIIGADGANSFVRRKFRFPERKRTLALALEAKLKYEDLDFYHNREIMPELFLGIINHGYGWVFPKKDEVILGIGGLVRKNKDLRKIFIEFAEKIAKRKLSSSEIKGFPLPFHNFVGVPAKKNILLVGDAAGLAEAITGEGIYFAIKSGQLAAQAIIDNSCRAVKLYNYSIKKMTKLLQQSHFIAKIFFCRFILPLEIKLMKRDVKYAKYYFDLISGDFDYRGFFRKVFFSKK